MATPDGKKPKEEEEEVISKVIISIAKPLAHILNSSFSCGLC